MDEPCLINSNLLDKRGCSHAFAGATHALSALAIFFTLFAFLSERFYGVLGSSDAFVVISAAIVITGASLIPDLDNSRSLAHSTLSAFGGVLSAGMKSASVAVQGLTATKYDKDDRNPHRKLWHTFFAWTLVGIGLTALFSLPGSFTLPFLGTRTVGWLFALLVFFTCFQLSLMGLFAPKVKKAKGKFGPVGEVVIDVLTFVGTFYLMSRFPSDAGFRWMAVAFVIGTFVHLFGDLLTKMGIPAFFPLRIKGKRWFFVRILPLTSGGTVEKAVFGPLFILIIAASILKLTGVFSLIGVG